MQGSVIYMKKIRNSKRGFTLTEIIVVVAIIVIVSAAAFVGIAITINNAKANSARVEARHGQDSDGKELFEAEAWDAVDSLAKGAAKFFDVATYDPDTTPNAVAVDEETVSGDLSGENAGGGGGDTSSATPTKPVSATNTPIPTSTPVPTTPPPTTNPGAQTTISGTNTVTNMEGATAPVNNYLTWGSPVIETRVSVPQSSNYSTVTIVIKYTSPVDKINDYWNGQYSLDSSKTTMTITTTPGSDFGIQAYSGGNAEVVSIIGS